MDKISLFSVCLWKLPQTKDRKNMNNESPSASLALDDIQGLVLRGYNQQRYIRHFIFTISSDPKAIAGIQEFCGKLVPGSRAALTVTTAQDWGDAPPPYCLNIGFTNLGLQKVLGANNYETVAYGQLFTPAFEPGAAARAPYVGDTDTSAPANWWQYGGWQSGVPTDAELDFLVSLYVTDPSARDTFAAELLAMIPNGSDGNPAAVPAFIMDSDPILDSSGNPTPDIHFGYHDGISQPRIQGTPWDDPGSPDDDLPLVPSYFFAVSGADAAPYNAHPLFYDGCFGAFRLLYQNVGAFEDFIAAGPEGAELLAAKICGRWRDGTPLEVSPDAPVPTLTELQQGNFGYLGQTPHQKTPLPAPASDTTGERCPYAAHTRRANPRDDTNVAFNNDYAQIHRVRRFATPFGPPYTPETGDAYRGLVGLFMGADLVNQFEFIMQTWIGQGSFRSPDLSPNHSGVDAFFGPQAQPPPSAGDASFDYLSSDGSTWEERPGLTRFIRTDGGLYVFLPGISALGDIAQGTLPKSLS
jgi:deferrochelatase/peroxidase EfeB